MLNPLWLIWISSSLCCIVLYFISFHLFKYSILNFVILQKEKVFKKKVLLFWVYSWKCIWKARIEASENRSDMIFWIITVSHVCSFPNGLKIKSLKISYLCYFQKLQQSNSCTSGQYICLFFMFVGSKQFRHFEWAEFLPSNLLWISLTICSIPLMKNLLVLRNCERETNKLFFNSIKNWTCMTNRAN